MEKPLSEYPRPQLVRDSYLCLNGNWQYAIRKTGDIPSTFDGEILVPFSPEKEKSGVNKMVCPNDFLFYKTSLDIPKEYNGEKVLLHFGAVDQIADVYINGIHIGNHIGGFLPFEFDIKPFLKENNILVVRVQDFTDSSYYSRGKQRLHRGGIWYTSQSGIYMPVWIESVSNDYIKNLVITPDIDNSSINITVLSDSDKAFIEIDDEEIEVKTNIPNSSNNN